MVIIHSGGVNASLSKSDPQFGIYGFGNYFMLQIRQKLLDIIDSGGSIAVCVAAKVNKHHYDQRFKDMGFQLGSFEFLGREDSADWERYDAILMLGGETKELHKWLTKTRFNVKNMKKCQFIAGDSAGAYVLAKKTLIEYEPDGSHFEIADGFIPTIETLVAAHVNNEHYHQSGLGKALSQWCSDNNIKYVELKENQIHETVIKI